MAELNYSYIFRCTNKTVEECFERMLFGENERAALDIQGAQIDDTIFLYNTDEETLMGPFTATSPLVKDSVPHAWGGNFPYQIHVERKSDMVPLKRNDIEKVIEFRNVGKRKLYPKDIKLGIEATEKLLELFESKDRDMIEFKKSTLGMPSIRTEDGHFVRSEWERRIDNWLYSKLLTHAYEKRINISEPMICDFYIKKGTRNNNEDIYIELWGKNDEKYRKRREIKIGLYKKHGLNLVELVPEDMARLDEVLTEKLKTFRVL